MCRVLCVTLLVVVMALGTDANKRAKNHKGVNQEGAPSDCSPAHTRYGRCVPDQGDCGDGRREAACSERPTRHLHCRVACNWKKDISDCKYKFGPWGPCDETTSSKSRSGSLKRALFNAECQSAITVSKPCSPRARRTRGEKKTK